MDSCRLTRDDGFSSNYQYFIRAIQSKSPELCFKSGLGACIMEAIHYLTALILGILVLVASYGAYSSVANQANQSVQNSISDALDNRQSSSSTSNTKYFLDKNTPEVCIKCYTKKEKEYRHLPRL